MSDFLKNPCVVPFPFMQLAWGKENRDIIIESDLKVELELMVEAAATSAYHYLVIDKNHEE